MLAGALDQCGGLVRLEPRPARPFGPEQPTSDRVRPGVLAIDDRVVDHHRQHLEALVDRTVRERLPEQLPLLGGRTLVPLAFGELRGLEVVDGLGSDRADVKRAEQGEEAPDNAHSQCSHVRSDTSNRRRLNHLLAKTCSVSGSFVTATGSGHGGCHAPIRIAAMRSASASSALRRSHSGVDPWAP